MAVTIKTCTSCVQHHFFPRVYACLKTFWTCWARSSFKVMHLLFLQLVLLFLLFPPTIFLFSEWAIAVWPLLKDTWKWLGHSGRNVVLWKKTDCWYDEKKKAFSFFCLFLTPHFSKIPSPLAFLLVAPSLRLWCRCNDGDDQMCTPSLFWQTFSLARNIQTTFFFFQHFMNRQQRFNPETRAFPRLMLTKLRVSYPF